ncbi:hypothetical protein K1T71_015195 [Dendrolimus kikuchii]|nr:hypothetical protein K1T71_015195 [Dendrolimus kikuchii]
MAVSQLTEFVARRIDNKEKCIGVFLDLAKVFDTVSIPILLNKMKTIDIRGIPFQLFKDYLTNRTQKVNIDGNVSSDARITHGSILSYCITSWGGARKSHLIKLERAQRALLKVIKNKPFRYPTSDLYRECDILTVRQLLVNLISASLRFFTIAEHSESHQAGEGILFFTEFFKGIDCSAADVNADTYSSYREVKFREETSGREFNLLCTKEENLCQRSLYSLYRIMNKMKSLLVLWIASQRARLGGSGLAYPVATIDVLQ